MEITRHFTSSVYIVSDKKVLLHFHQKLNLWLPPGGHIERDELPNDAALREVLEETGLKVKLHDPNPKFTSPRVISLPNPVQILLQDINQFHQHIDFVYYSEPEPNQQLQPEFAKSFKWFSLNEVKKLENLPENVLHNATESIKILSNQT